MDSPQTIREARRKSGLSAGQFGAALGYRHANNHNMRQQVYDMETGRKPVSAIVARLAEMFRRFGVPRDFLQAENPRWQDWQNSPEQSQIDSEKDKTGTKGGE